jgi:hypothetical protein
MISRLQRATNRPRAAAAALFLGGSRISSEIAITGSIEPWHGGGVVVLPGTAEVQKSTRNSDPICSTIESSGGTPMVRSVPAICCNPCVRGFCSAPASNGRIRIGSRSRETKRLNRTIAEPTRNLEVKFFTELTSSAPAGRLERCC